MVAITPRELQSLPLFQDLSTEQCEQLLDRHLENQHGPEQVLVMEGDWGESLFLLRSGMAKVRTFSVEGEEAVMALLGEGDIFGEMAALGDVGRSADVVALIPTSVIKIRAAAFQSLLNSHAPFALALARLEAARLRDLNQRFAIQAGDATTRLLDALAYLARCSSAARDPLAPIPPLAQREVGAIAGLARETASRTLSKLRSRGTVQEVDGMLRITDLKALRQRGLLPRSGATG